MGPLGFDLSEHAVRRAGLDYWPKLELHRHDDFDAFVAAFPGARPVLFTAGASRSYLDVELAPGDAPVFGRESVGLPRALLARFETAAIPTAGDIRSLNLSNAAAIVLYEGLRRSGQLADTFVERG